MAEWGPAQAAATVERMDAAPLPAASAHVASPARPRFRGVTHQWTFPMAVVAGAILIVLASGARERVAAAVYAMSLAGLFGTSALYHRAPWSQRLRGVLRRIDHSMIFVLIAGTITPFALLGMPTVSGVVMLAAAWAAAAGGVVISALWIDAPKHVKVALYLAYPLVCVAALPEIVDRLGLAPILLVIAGGVLYTVGAVVYAVAWPNPRPRVFGFHEIFHLFVIAAAVTHFAAVAVAVAASR